MRQPQKTYGVRINIMNGSERRARGSVESSGVVEWSGVMGRRMEADGALKGNMERRSWRRWSDGAME